MTENIENEKKYNSVKNPYKKSEESDPFYSESNIRHLENIMQRWKDGTARFEEHELIEVEE